MKRIPTLIIPKLKEFYRDRTAFIWNVVFPFLMLFILVNVTDKETSYFSIGEINKTSETQRIAVFDSLEVNEDITIDFKTFESLQSGLEQLNMEKLDLLVNYRDNSYWIAESSEKSKIFFFLMNNNKYYDCSNLHFMEHPSRNITYAHWLFPGIVVINILFGSLFGIGFTIVRYRKNGVLKRLQATPVTAFEFLVSQISVRFVIVVGYILVIYFGSILVFPFKIMGGHLNMLVFFCAGGLCLIALGVMLSSFSSSEEGGGGIINLVLWPMMFLSEIWYPLDNSSEVIKAISKIFPTTYILDGTREIMFGGTNLADNGQPLIILGIMTVAFMLISSILFKWQEK